MLAKSAGVASVAGAGLTIASCYISPEGVVFGADSTTTYALNEGNHYFNHAQKLFEIGESSSLGIVTWGLGGLIDQSYRTLIASLDDRLKAAPPATVQAAANEWIELFWHAYQSSSSIGPAIQRVGELHLKAPFDPQSAATGSRTENEEREYNNLRHVLVAGFCIGGYVLPDRTPMAFEILFDPLGPKPTALPVNGQKFWGAPNMINRLLFGCDDQLIESIRNSSMWTGTTEDLLSIIRKHSITHPVLPIRDAIDFTHACIMSTIKAIKFSEFSQICGGPVEIALITTDRKFRWVRHKPWDTAITEGEI